MTESKKTIVNENHILEGQVYTLNAELECLKVKGECYKNVIESCVCKGELVEVLVLSCPMFFSAQS